MSNAVNLRLPISHEQHLELLKRDNPDIETLLSVYPEEHAAKLVNNKKKLKTIIKAFSSVSVASSNESMILTCYNNCPYKDMCILKREDIEPTGYSCPIEKKIVQELGMSIIEALQIEQNNPIEMELLWDLIDMKLLDMRASAALKDGRLLQKVESKVGSNIMSSKDELSPLIEAKLDLKRLKHSIIDSFVATRRAKKKYGIGNDANRIEQMILEAANVVEEE